MSLENKIKFNHVVTSELCSNVTDGTHDTPKEVEFGKKLVTSKNILGGKLNLDNSYFISIDDFNKINKRSKVDKWDLLIYMIGVGVGEVALVKEEPDFAIKNLGLLKNRDETTAKWLYYYLRSPEGQYQIKTRVQGSTQPYIPLKELKRLEIPIPIDNNYLKYCVKILDNIDNKIEINEEINHNLERIEKEIFKFWFIKRIPFEELDSKDSDFGLIPLNWEETTIEELDLDISDGNYSAKYPKSSEFLDVGIPFIRGKDFKGKNISSDNLVFISEEKHSELLKGHTKKEDILMTTRGEIGHIAYVSNRFIDANINSQLMRINGNGVLPRSYLGGFLECFSIQNAIKSMVSGSALQQLPVAHFKKMKILLPPKEILTEYDNQISSLRELILQNEEENHRLKQLRDELLPRLMSGEIDVSEII